jgi:hypothetical protein
MFKGQNSFSSKSKEQTLAEKARSYPLENKPFARALIYRTSQFLDEEESSIKEDNFFKILGLPKQEIENIKDSIEILKEASHSNQKKTLEEFAAMCAIQLAFRITLKARESMGGFAFYAPPNPVPKEAPSVAAFAILLVTAFQSHLKSEGINLDYSQLIAPTGSLFFLSFSQEQKSFYVKQAFDIFQTLIGNKSQNVINWLDQLGQLIPAYIMQWTSNEEEYRNIDCIPIFGKMLAGLVSAIEY